ncbi:MAG: SHOCT domain-containing protein [Alphaproteobacteria bacterium]
MPATAHPLMPPPPQLRSCPLFGWVALGLAVFCLAVFLLLAAPSALGAALGAETGTALPVNMWERGGWDGWRAHIMVMWPVFLLLVVVGAIFLAMRLYHEFWPGSPHVNPRSPVASGHQILAERFARGEIDETEYRAKRKALGKR